MCVCVLVGRTRQAESFASLSCSVPKFVLAVGFKIPDCFKADFSHTHSRALENH